MPAAPATPSRGRTPGRASELSQARDTATQTASPQENQQASGLCAVSEPRSTRRRADGHRGREEDFDCGEDFGNPYSRSKFEAERIVRAVIADGLDATVHRVGGLAGDSPAGTFLAGPRGTVLYRLLRVITGCGLVPDAPGFTVNLTPAGFAAGAVLRLWAATANSGRAFHVRNPADLTMPGLTALPRDLGYPVILADPERIARWLARDGASGAEREALPFLGQFAGQPGTLIRCDTLAPSSGATRRRHARRLPI